MVSPNDISQLTDTLFNNSIMKNILVYSGYTLLVVTVLGLFVVIYYLTQYKYKVTYPVLLYDSDRNSAQVIKFKNDRARIVKKKDGSRKTHFLFCKKTTEPFKQEHIRGNRVFLLRINNDGTYTPYPSYCLSKPDKDGNQVPVNFETFNEEEKQWAILELKESAQSLTSEDAQKRILVYTIIAILILVVFVILGIWLTLKYTGNVTTALKDITPSLGQIAQGLGGTAPQ